MELPQQLRDAIANALKDRYFVAMSQDIRLLDLAIDDSFLSDGFAGSEILHLNATVLNHGISTEVSLFTKRWNPSALVKEQTKLTVWLERLFFETGVFDHINSIKGIYVPVIGTVQIANYEWIIMTDVSSQLARWKDATAGPNGPFWRTTPDCVGLYADLLDRTALLNANWEEPTFRNKLRSIERYLISQETSLRSLEGIFREWFDSLDSFHMRSQAAVEANANSAQKGTQWASKENFASARRNNYQAFLDRLSERDRSIWIKHMQCRDTLVEEASTLPQTLLHGDLNWRNIGLSRAEAGNDFILIDWEFAAFGSHALEVIGFVSGRAFSADEQLSLEEHYFDRYKYHGGRLLDKKHWNRACQVAMAYMGICQLPHNSEIVRRQNLATYTANIEARIERTLHALHGLTQ